MNQFRSGLRFAVLAAACALSSLPDNALAQRDPSPEPYKPMPPRRPLLTMDQKVDMANHIFVGVGKRVYFADEVYKEVSQQDAYNPYRAGERALLEIEVEQTLYSKSPSPPKLALMPANGSTQKSAAQPSGYEAIVTRFVGVRQLFFGQMQTDQIRIDMPEGPSKVIGQVTLHQFIVYDAIEGPNENPLSVSYLPEAMAAVERRIEREKREAADAAAKKSSKQ